MDIGGTPMLLVGGVTGRIGVPPVLLLVTENWRVPGSAALTDWAARHRTAILR